MRKLLNTLFILSEETYLSLDGENIVILAENSEKRRFPLHMLENIMCFSYKGASVSYTHLADIFKCVIPKGN